MLTSIQFKTGILNSVTRERGRGGGEISLFFAGVSARKNHQAYFFEIISRNEASRVRYQVEPRGLVQDAREGGRHSFAAPHR